MRRIRNLYGASVAALAFTTVSGAPAAAQVALDEIVVTAQKRVESEQDTPISMAVFGTAEIERRNITNIGNLVATVPNMRVAPFGVTPTTLRVFIRGLGVTDSQITQDSPVGIYINGVYIARPVALSLDIPDIERVEVLRGPQGTLYGRNTTGGAVNVITKKPDADLSFSQYLGYGNFGALRSQTTVNLPLGKTFYIAAAFSIHRRDGWLKNTGVGPDFSFLNSKSGRVDARWLPIDGVTIDYSYDEAQTRYTGDYYHLTQASDPGALLPGLPTQPHRLKEASLLAPFQPGEDHASGHTLTVAVETPVGEIKSITAFRKIHANAYNDYSANPFLTVFRNESLDIHQKQFSQELQLIGETKTKEFSYVAGVYYFRENAHEVGLDQFFTVPLPRNIHARNTSRAIYGQATFRPHGTAPWSVTVGARYTEDERLANNAILPTAHRKDHKVTGSIVADYRLGQNALLYAKVVQGYKAGGFNMRQAAFDQSFGPENLVSYEAGLKSELFERRLRVNLAAFYMDYKDIQFDVIVPDQPDPTLTRTINAGKARIFGLEADITFQVTDGLRISASYGLTDGKIQKVAGDDASFYRLIEAPKHSLAATVDWDIVRTDVGTLNFSTNTFYRSSTVSEARRVPGWLSPGYSLTDARLSFSGNDWFARGTKVTVSGWMKNVFDKEYSRMNMGSFYGVHADRLTSYGLPRTYGVEMKVEY